MQKKHISLMVLLILCVALCAQGKMSLADFEKEVWRLTNVERTKNGLPALIYDDGLASLARWHSTNMKDLGFFAHRDPWGDEVAERKSKYYPQLIVSSVGENLGKFTNSRQVFTPQEIVQGWMNSPSHRDNILDRSYTHLGVGIIPNGADMYATQNFAAPIVKLLSQIPDKLDIDKVYRLRFEYMGNRAKTDLSATLIYPDLNATFKISDKQEMCGAQPIAIKWAGNNYFDADVPFLVGKGPYMLCFGFEGGYFPEGVIMSVK